MPDLLLPPAVLLCVFVTHRLDDNNGSYANR